MNTNFPICNDKLWLRKTFMFYHAEFTQLAAKLRNSVCNLHYQPALHWRKLTWVTVKPDAVHWWLLLWITLLHHKMQANCSTYRPQHTAGDGCVCCTVTALINSTVYHRTDHLCQITPVHFITSYISKTHLYLCHSFVHLGLSSGIIP
jgi:hypothetical protein